MNEKEGNLSRFILGLLVLFVVSSISLIPAFGHGFGYEVLPVKIGDHEAALSLLVSPPTFEPDNKEYEMTVNLSDSKTQAIIENVTYLIEVIKDDKTIFKLKFHDDFGNLYIKSLQKDSDQVEISGKYDEKIGWMKKDDFNPIQLEGPIFSSGGLYEFNIQILTVDRDDNFLEKPITLNAAISIAEKTTYEVTTENGSQETLGITSYFDTVNDFQYFADLKKIYFSMPFDWTDEVLNQVSIVHEEIHIPKTFLGMMATNYDASVNGIPLPATSIQVDDYSNENDRIVHLVIPNEQLFAIRDSTSQTLSSDIEFTVSPAKEIKLPLSVYANAQYQIDLWWEPQIISANKNITFFVDLKELYTIKKEQVPISFDFVLLKDDKELFKKNIQSQLNGPPKSTPIEYKFSNDQTGLITVSIQNIGENEFAKNKFNVVVTPQEIRNKVFPVRLVSKGLNDQSSSGKYYVDLTWFPSNLRINESSEFVITIYNRATGAPIPQAEYDFVLLQNGNEIYRTAGFAKAGGSFENYVFSENQIGDVILRIENIDKSEQFVEIPVVVTPEFPLGLALVFPALIFFVMMIQKFNLKF